MSGSLCGFSPLDLNLSLDVLPGDPLLEGESVGHVPQECLEHLLRDGDIL